MKTGCAKREPVRGRGRTTQTTRLNQAERELLESIVRAGTTEQRIAQRARILLELAKGKRVSEVAETTGVSEKTIYKWRKRFREEGIDGLNDAPRQGRPPIFNCEQKMQVISVACTPRYDTKNGLNGWTLEDIRQEVIKRGIVDNIGKTSVWRFLNEIDIKPYKVRGWVHSQDPEFGKKVHEICNLYLNPPENAVVVCIDEKAGIQAVERLYPDKPARPGQPMRREFGYIRHGTQALIASFCIQDGKVVARVGKTRTAKDLIKFMNQVAKAYPDKQVHVIWDNLNIHTGERWKKFNDKHGGRFHFHYTPFHASWVNQIEIWFRILSRKSLKNGSFKSTQHLKKTIKRFIKYWNEEIGHPFQWSYKGSPLKE